MSSASRVVVLDDDPTGTQAVSGLPIVLNCDQRTLQQVADTTSGPVWILTNTRAMAATAAIIELTRIVALARDTFGDDVQFVLRGDSTLRGHVLEEIAVLAVDDSAALFVPAYVEQGRLTLDSVHYSRIGKTLIPVAETEYARDASFAYSTSHLGEWISQREPGRPTVLVPLARIRESGPEAIRQALLNAPSRSVVIPDAETLADVQSIHDGWVQAKSDGRNVVLRCSSTLAAVAVGSRTKTVPLEPVDGPVLVVCGSHTTGATSQLERLRDGLDANHIELPIPSSQDHTVDQVQARINASLERHRVTVVSTPRLVPDDWRDIDAGARVMDTLVEAVAAITAPIAAIVTKGGITSARIPRDALGARTAWVLGQSLPGIPVWLLQRDPGSLLVQVVVPGNVGGPDAIRSNVDRLINVGNGSFG